MAVHLVDMRQNVDREIDPQPHHQNNEGHGNQVKRPDRNRGKPGRQDQAENQRGKGQPGMQARPQSQAQHDKDQQQRQCQRDPDRADDALHLFRP